MHPVKISGQKDKTVPNSKSEINLLKKCACILGKKIAAGPLCAVMCPQKKRTTKLTSGGIFYRN